MRRPPITMPPRAPTPEIMRRLDYNDREFYDFFCKNPLDKITDNIYLGNCVGAHNHQLLLDNGITDIISVAPYDLDYIDIICHKYIWYDISTFDISKLLPETLNLLENLVNNNRRVFVHCQAGISRSATLIIAYLMKSNKMTYIDAYNYVKERRSIIKPNQGFINFLKEYELQIMC